MDTLELDKILVRGFKSISEIDISLRPINLLIGANGSGKSNFIEVFALLHAVREGQLQNYVQRAGGGEQLLHFGSKKTKKIEIKISFENEVNKYDLELEPSEDDSLFPSHEVAYYWDKRYPSPYERHLSPNEGNEAGISNPRLSGTGDWVRSRLGRWRIYHVHDTSSSSPMRKSAKLDDNEFLRSDGSNLPAFLYLLRNSYKSHYELIRKSVQRIAPYFDDFRLRPNPLNKETIRLAWSHKDSDLYFGASALSDGTLRFIALAALFLQPKELRPSIIIVDEPELGLHPAAIALLASLIKQAATSTQVIASTQSALLLDYFEPKDVLVASRRDDGTKLKRLDPAPLAEWLDDYSLGQLWEKNHLGGRPSS